MALQSDLSAHLGAAVGLVEQFTAEDVLRLQVIEHGRVPLERTSTDRVRFEMHALSWCAHLDDERRGILEDVVHHGGIYR